MLFSASTDGWIPVQVGRHHTSPACRSHARGSATSITVLRDRTQVRIRLHGIDSPETGQDFGSRSKQAASELAFGKTVTVRVRDTDRYGRTVAEVILPDGRSLNREMVGAGMAWWYRQYAPADTELARLETEAKAAKRGSGASRTRSRPGPGARARGCRRRRWSSATAGATSTTSRLAGARQP